MEWHSRQHGESIPNMGIILLIFICGLWGGNAVSIKLSIRGLPPLLTATCRSIVAALCLLIYGKITGNKVLLKNEDLPHGIVIGFLFGFDFLFLYLGLAHTHASRAVIFVYTHAMWVALGAHFLFFGDRLNTSRAAGLLTAFGGLVLIFAFRAGGAEGPTWHGDLMVLVAAIFWAATTLYMKVVMAQRSISHYQTLFAQLIFSIPILGIGFYLLERGQPVKLDFLVISSFTYQSLVIAFFSYQLWAWMIGRFPVSRLASFTFLSPIFGVIFGSLFLHEPLSFLLWVGLAMVAFGIYMVNKVNKP